jgi:hypothetical protein
MWAETLHKHPPTAHNDGGGEFMEHNAREIVLGQVTYELSRVYVGDRSPAQLLAAQLAAKYSENSSFDGVAPGAV